MPRFDHVIIGGGMTGNAAAKAIRERRPGDSIVMLTRERHRPYDRPPLTKGLWKGELEETIWQNSVSPDVDVRVSCSVVELNPGEHTVVDETGERYTYGKLLLATGGKPRTLPGAPEGTIVFRTLDDYHRLREAARPGSRAVVIGGGFIGSELAAGLCQNDVHVTMLFPEATIGGRVYPEGLGRFIDGYFGKRGVDVRPGELVERLTREGERFVAETRSGKRFEAESVVVGMGIMPDVGLAERAGVQTGNGISVDDHLRTSAPDVYAAGDIANFFNPALGKRIRVEHENGATSMGAAAGRNMAGDDVTYDYLPFFYSDLFDLGYEAIGELDARLETVEDWVEPYQQGVVYYLEESRVRGVLLWNVWEQVDNARRLIADPGPWNAGGVRGQIAM